LNYAKRTHPAIRRAPTGQAAGFADAETFNREAGFWRNLSREGRLPWHRRLTLVSMSVDPLAEPAVPTSKHARLAVYCGWLLMVLPLTGSASPLPWLADVFGRQFEQGMDSLTEEGSTRRLLVSAMPDLASGTNKALLDEAFFTRGKDKATFEYAAYELEARDPKSTGTKPPQGAIKRPPAKASLASAALGRVLNYANQTKAQARWTKDRNDWASLS